MKAFVRRQAPEVLRSGRRAVALSRARARAALAGSAVAISIAPDADLAATIDFDVWPGTSTTVVIGPGVRIEDHVRLSLRGGRLSIGAGTQVRRLGTYEVTGQLHVGAGVVLAAGVFIHCAAEVAVGDLTIIGEYTTIADSAHVRTPPGVPIHHSVTTAPVRLGSNIWVGAHAVIASGVTVGDQAFVGAGAVVTRDVAPGWLVAGVPARPVHEL